MTRLQHDFARLQRYNQGLSSGLLSLSEVASAVLEDLADVSVRAELWAGMPAELRSNVLAYLAAVGANNVPPVLWIGPGEPDPNTKAEHTARRRLLAAELLAGAKPTAATDGGSIARSVAHRDGRRR